ncbi:MAG: hypothetical protein KBG42_05810 [Lachnospiraceae bacterium]|nr:hypothetical protein [Lachnospiraceae bacterium]
MRIESSVTGMESERSYSAVSYSERNLKVAQITGSGISGELGFGARGGGASFMDTLLGKYGDKAEKLEAPETAEDEKAEDKKATLMDIMGDMSVRGITPEESSEAVGPDTSMYVRKMSVLYIFSLLFEDYRKRIDELMADLRSGYEKCDTASVSKMNPELSVVMKFDMTEKHYFKETEDTGFSSKGKAVTADGRAIDFDINVHMSREFEKYSEERMQFDKINRVDPLVINLKPGVTEVSDQEFYFDLDSDGKEDKIKSLAPGNGFLALDINSDGIVNDGSELFGTKSGNGFEELSRFDSDGDGWIDEDDDIFDKLRVWVREDGNDKLLSFKEAGIGAINLMNASTEYSLKDMTNKTNAIIRATGMFLYEDGRAGTLQQVDMVS